MASVACACGHRPEVNDEDCLACGQLLDAPMCGGVPALLGPSSLRYRRSFAAVRNAEPPAGFAMQPPSGMVGVRQLQPAWNQGLGPELAALLHDGDGGPGVRDEVAEKMEEEDRKLALRLQEEENRKAQRRQAREERLAKQLAEMLREEEQRQLETDMKIARGLSGNEGRCRFCQKMCVVEDPTLAPVCGYTEDCKTKQEQFCPHICDCKHPCTSTRDCTGDDQHHCERCSGDACPICLEGFDQDPALRLESCAHVAHVECFQETLNSAVQRQGPGMKVNVVEFSCSLCRVPIVSPVLEAELEEPKKTQAAVLARGMERAEREKEIEVLRLRNGPELDLMRRITTTYAFYRCKTCKEIFCGGREACEEAGGREEDQGQAQCGPCIMRESGGGKPCEKHGQEDLMIKCDFCCQQASYHCWGTTHFCEQCHTPPITRKSKPCNPETCPLRGKHPPNPTKGYIIGCQKCFSEQ